jgi:DNA-binding NarL/FixJ family response regulator
MADPSRPGSRIRNRPVDRVPDRPQTPLQPADLSSTLSYWKGQVLLMAAEHTSAQLAEQLQLALTTINKHLARAYSKVGIHGRNDLREIIDAHVDIWKGA